MALAPRTVQNIRTVSYGNNDGFATRSIRRANEDRVTVARTGYASVQLPSKASGFDADCLPQLCLSRTSSANPQRSYNFSMRPLSSRFWWYIIQRFC